MNDKEVSNVISRLTEAIDKLDILASDFSKSINKLISYCIITMLLIFAVFVISILV